MERLVRVGKPSNTDIGSNVKHFRLARGLTQEELSKIVGVERKTIIRVEAGHHSSRIDTLLDIARALKVDPKKLLD